MIRSTTLLTGIAGVMLMAAPAFAQDPNPTEAPASAEAQAPAQPGTLQIQPGSDVKGSDGSVLGKLEGVRNHNGAQELTVRGSDGKVRGVPLAGLRQEGSGVVVGWTSSDYQAAPEITDGSTAPADAATDAEAPAPTPPTAPTEPTDPTANPPAEPTTPPTDAPN